mmetsp:Transcript_15857/g.64803  ORF Transcript_15857/g.64803 Transcript_15857/m.64803 type:complete len:128 (+) Transcript_15857:160-543(+)
MDGSQFPNGSYQSGNMDSPGMGQQSFGDGQAGSGYGGYRRVSSPPGLEHRMSPPMQYIPGSFQPPQMFQRSQQQPPYGPPAHDSGKVGVISEGQAVSFTEAELPNSGRWEQFARAHWSKHSRQFFCT